MSENNQTPQGYNPLGYHPQGYHPQGSISSGHDARENAPSGYDPRVYGTGAFSPQPGYMPPAPVKRHNPNGWKIWIAAFCALALIAATVTGALLGQSLARDTMAHTDPVTLMTAGGNSHEYIQSLQNSEYGSIADLAEDVGHCVVSITIRKGQSSFLVTSEEETLGSGIIIGENEESIFIATNFHVIENASYIGVYLDDLTKPLKATVRGSDTDTDLSVLSILKKDVEERFRQSLKIAVFGDSDQCRLGDLAIAIGSAYDIRFGNSVTAGTISGLERSVTFVDPVTNVGQTMIFLQTDAAINPGNSGGALVNGRGEVIGINNYKIEDTEVEGMGFATPSNVARPVLEDLINNGRVSRPYIGVTGIDIINYNNYAVEYSIPSGVLVLTVVQDGPSMQAGLLPYDVITAVDGEEILGFDDLTEIISSHLIGDTIEITVLRGYREGQAESLSFELIIGEKDSTTR